MLLAEFYGDTIVIQAVDLSDRITLNKLIRKDKSGDLGDEKTLYKLQQEKADLFFQNVKVVGEVHRLLKIKLHARPVKKRTGKHVIELRKDAVFITPAGIKHARKIRIEAKRQAAKK